MCQGGGSQERHRRGPLSCRLPCRTSCGWTEPWAFTGTGAARPGRSLKESGRERGRTVGREHKVRRRFLPIASLLFLCASPTLPAAGHPRRRVPEVDLQGVPRKDSHSSESVNSKPWTGRVRRAASISGGRENRNSEGRAYPSQISSKPRDLDSVRNPRSLAIHVNPLTAFRAVYIKAVHSKV